jgi:Fic family protein
MDDLKKRLDRLRPLSEENIHRLWPMWENDDILHVYASNAIEGGTLTLSETRVVLGDGITIGGKSVREHIEAIDGQKAYGLMLRLAKENVPVTTAVIRNLHRAVVGNAEYAGQWREHPVYITGSRHVPPNYVKVPELLDKMIRDHEASPATEHPVARAAMLHFDLVRIHPFVDGNGRTARLLANLDLIRNGFAPVLIDKEDRQEYFTVLERCTLSGEPGKGNPQDFIAFVERFEEKALERYLRALEVSEGIPFDESARQVGLKP